MMELSVEVLVEDDIEVVVGELVVKFESKYLEDVVLWELWVMLWGDERCWCYIVDVGGVEVLVLLIL